MHSKYVIVCWFLLYLSQLKKSIKFSALFLKYVRKIKIHLAKQKEIKYNMNCKTNPVAVILFLQPSVLSHLIRK